MYGNSDVLTMTCQRLIYRVIHYLVYKVVQAFDTDITDVHRGALTHRFKTF
jgi:hypothetical protein